MFCIRCGQEMPDNLNFCTNCGNDLSDGKAAVQAGMGAGPASRPVSQPSGPAYQAAQNRQPMTPGAYGAPAGQQVYPVNPAMAAGRNATPQPNASGSNKTVPIIIAVGVIVALVLAAVLYFTLGGKDDNTLETKPVDTVQNQDSREGANSGSSASSSSSSSSTSGGESEASKQPDTQEQKEPEEPVASGPPRFARLSASSVLTGDIDGHQPDCLVDGDTTTAWCEGISGTGEGEWIQFDADMKQNVSSIRIMAGFNKSEDLYWKNSRPKEITITFDDGTTTKSTLSDEPFAWHTITLSESVQTSSIRITIDSTYPGSRYTDTCISEITIQ